MLADAFQDDPVMTFIFPDPADRRKRLPRLFAILCVGRRRSRRLLPDGGR